MVSAYLKAMQLLNDLSAVQALLQRGINSGHWTLEQLDFPSPDYERNLIEARRSEYFGPTYEPPKPYANPLRSPNTGEAVQPISPRDFDVAAATRPSEGQRNVDLLPHQWPPVPRVSHEPDLSRDQDTPADGGDHGQPPHLGTTGQHHPQSVGGDGTSAVQPQPAAQPLSSAPW